MLVALFKKRTKTVVVHFENKVKMCLKFKVD